MLYRQIFYCQNKHIIASQTIQFMQQDEFVDDLLHQQFIEIKGLAPANPIYIKPSMSEQPKVVFKVELLKNQINSKDPKKFAIKQESQEQDNNQAEPDVNSPIARYVVSMKCMYTKFNNLSYNTLHRTEYFSGLFADRREYKANKAPISNLKQFFNQIIGEEINVEEDLMPSATQVKFDSHFESGNLFGAYKRSERQYDLVLQNDINSKGNTQWFYFSVSNLPTSVDIIFNIINLTKSDSLFNYGMQPAVFSKAGNKKTGQGWYRSGKEISYYKNEIRREYSRRYFYTLTFKLRCQYPGDTLFIAHCFPYTFSALQEYLDALVKNQYRKSFVQRSVIGRSVGNHNIECITIAEPSSILKDSRKIILFMTRQHPGQSQSSFVCEGVINFLVSKTKQAEFLRSKYIIKIIPMLNPDGVIFGNYRTNLAGLDLNRKWDGGDNYGMFSEVTTVRSYIAELHRQRKVRYIIDLHGHSKKLNSFFYGNPSQHHPEMVRMLPFICSKLNPQISFEDCTFSIQEQKRRTARVYLSLTHQISCIYTYQVSFFGYIKDGKKVAFGIEQFRGLGNTLCQGLFNVLESEWLIEHKQSPNTAITKYLNQLKTNVNLIEMGNRSSSGSDSQPQLFELKENQVEEIQQKVNQNKHQRLIQRERQKQLIKHSFERSEPTEANVIMSNTLIPPLISSNCLPSRSTVRSSKQSSRPFKKKMIVMSLSKVNSILPDKYQMALEPMHKKEINSKQWRPIRGVVNPEMGIQTDYLEEKDWIMMRRIDSEKKQGPGGATNYKTWRSKQSKYISVSTATRVRKNMVLKMELTPKPLLSVTNYNTQPFYKVKQQQAQTNLTIYHQPKNTYQQKMRTITYFGNSHQETERAPRIQPVPIIRALKIHSLRQDSNILFDDMIKRYLIDAEKFKTKMSPSDSHIFFEKNNNFGSSLEKSLSIKKKQIAPSKRQRKRSD